MALGSVIRELGVKVSLMYDKKQTEQAKQGFDKFTSALKSTGFQVAGLAASIFGITELTGDYGRSLKTNSAALGINVEKLQEMQYAAKVVAGVTEDELTGALQGLNETLFQARSGNTDAAKTLSDLGFSLGELTDPAMTSDKILMRVSKTFAQMPDGVYKTSLAMKLGGATMAKLIPVMGRWDSEAKKARASGVIFNPQQIERMAAFQEGLSRLMFQVKNFGYVIGMALMKPVGELVQQFLAWASANRKAIATGIVEFAKALGTYLKIAFKVAELLFAGFVKLVNIFGGAENAGKAFVVVLGAMVAANIISGITGLVTAFTALAGIAGTVISGITALAAPFLGVAAAVGATIAVVHDLWKLIQGGKIEDTWIGGLIIGAGKLLDSLSIVKDLLAFKDKLESGVADWGKDKLGSIKSFSSSSAEAKPTSNAVAAGTINNAANNANNSFTTNVNISGASGMGPGQLSDAVAGGAQQGHEAMLRATRNATIGGTAY